jgi:hypothetical protein
MLWVALSPEKWFWLSPPFLCRGVHPAGLVSDEVKHSLEIDIPMEPLWFNLCHVCWTDIIWVELFFGKYSRVLAPNPVLSLFQQFPFQGCESCEFRVVNHVLAPSPRNFQQFPFLNPWVIMYWHPCKPQTLKGFPFWISGYQIGTKPQKLWTVSPSESVGYWQIQYVEHFQHHNYIMAKSKRFMPLSCPRIL